MAESLTGPPGPAAKSVTYWVTLLRDREGADGVGGGRVGSAAQARPDEAGALPLGAGHLDPQQGEMFQV
jgi:hypothetical protein